MRFDAANNRGRMVVMDVEQDAGGTDAGPSPMQAVLMAMAGCTGMDVVSILRKMRASLEGLIIHVEGARAAEHPKVFTGIHLRYQVWGVGLEHEPVERAVTLSLEKYCPVAAMLKKTADVTYDVVISEPRRPRPV
jgi:putative redox protein